MNCDGTERHEHYVIATGQCISHVHKHSVRENQDFNRLHHHSPLEHDKFTDEELIATEEPGTEPVF